MIVLKRQQAEAIGYSGGVPYDALLGEFEQERLRKKSQRRLLRCAMNSSSWSMPFREARVVQTRAC